VLTRSVKPSIACSTAIRLGITLNFDHLWELTSCVWCGMLVSGYRGQKQLTVSWFDTEDGLWQAAIQ